LFSGYENETLEALELEDVVAKYLLENEMRAIPYPRQAPEDLSATEYDSTLSETTGHMATALAGERRAEPVEDGSRAQIAASVSQKSTTGESTTHRKNIAKASGASQRSGSQGKTHPTSHRT